MDERIDFQLVMFNELVALVDEVQDLTEQM